jgi:thiamine biosynthesis lipoprotein
MSTATIQGQTVDRIHRRIEHLMGMPISLALRGRHASSGAGEKAWQAVINQLHEVDVIFSTYRDDSIINRLDRAELTIDQCPAEVAEVLKLGRKAQRASAGAFSIMLPTAEGRRRLDPSGVVKGWAVQRASVFLAELEETDFCLSAGGDIVCHTALPDSAAWRIGIEDPHDPTKLIAMVPIRSGAVATSGSAYRGDHLVDPRTGQPPQAIASVTVIETSLTWADIDATAAYVHGPDAARWLQTRPVHSALIIWADGGATRIPEELETSVVTPSKG